jgi:hypothetical protein
MENSKLQYDPQYGYLPSVLLLIYSVFDAGFVLADMTTLKETKEITCLALNIYFEARSESEQGQLAVGYVVMNRVAHERYPDSICGVVKQGGEKRRYHCQFTWWCDGRSDLPINKKAWKRSLDLAWAIYKGHAEDPTGGALWYHADYVSPQWSASLVLGKKIGQHLFYLSKKQPVYAHNTTSTLESAVNPINDSDELIKFPYFQVSPSYSGMGISTSFPILQL